LESLVTAESQVATRLPLEYFDDPTRYETKSPQEILEGNKDPNVFLEAFSKYHFILSNTAVLAGAGWKWTKCKVLEYDRDTELFRIEWEESTTRKWVRRFNLLFPGEKLADVSQRMEQASKARELYEEINMNARLIGSSTVEDMAPYPESFKLGILGKIGRKILKTERKLIVMLSNCRKKYFVR
jgi:hypothetical protein